jgi:hypothetical protein
VIDAPEDVSCGAPKKKDSKLSKEFQGRLSHASPQIRTSLITKFFSPRERAGLVSDSKSEPTENFEIDTFNVPVSRASPKKECDKISETTVANSEYHLLIYKVTLSVVLVV